MIHGQVFAYTAVSPTDPDTPRGFAVIQVWVSSSRERELVGGEREPCIAAVVYHTGIGIAGDDKPTIAQLIIGY